MSDKSHTPRQRTRRAMRVWRPFSVGQTFYHSGIGQNVIPLNAVDPDQPGGGRWLVAWIPIEALPNAKEWAHRIVRAVNRSRR